MTSPIPDEDSFDGHLARRIVRAAATAVAQEECRQLGGADPTGGHGFYSAGIVAAHAMFRVLAEALPGDPNYAVEVDFAVLADLIENDTATLADPGVYRDRRPWRVGNHYSIHIYAVTPDGADDESIGTAHTPWAARQIVAEHNARIAEAAA